MAHSILPEPVLEGFGLRPAGKVVSREGLVDDTFLVNTEQGDILIRRRSSRIMAERVSAEHGLIAHLNSQGFPTALPITAADGAATFFTYQERLYEAFPQLTGEPFTIGDREQINTAGRTLGKFHVLARGYKPEPPYPHDKPLIAYLDVAAEVRPIVDALVKRRELSPDGRKFVRELSKELRAQAVAFKGERLPRVIVHGAFEPESIVFGSEGQLLDVGNWTQSRVFGRAFEAAYGLLRFVGRRPDAVLPGQSGPIFGWPRVEAFVEGYRESVVLTDAEARLVPALILAIRLRDSLYSDGLARNYPPRELRLLYELRKWLAKNGETLSEMLS